MPFYHRIVCSFLNERLLQSMYFQIFYVVPPDLYDIVWNIVSQKVCRRGQVVYIYGRLQRPPVKLTEG